MITLTYIFHDCFVLKTNKCALIFDFWKDPYVSEDELPLFLRNLPSEFPIYCIVSHHHKDHFTRRIFDWQINFPQMKFIISRDTFKSCRFLFRQDSLYNGYKPPIETVHILSSGEIWEDKILKITAFESTDIGNAYLVEIGGRKIFHAGDLNAWVWKDESTKVEVENEIIKFRKCIDPLRKITDHLDIAMFPVDSRIGTDYWEGASLFVREFSIDRFFPMHFSLGDNEEEQRRYQLDASRFELYANPQHGEYIALQTPYSAFAIH